MLHFPFDSFTPERMFWPILPPTSPWFSNRTKPSGNRTSVEADSSPPRGIQTWNVNFSKNGSIPKWSAGCPTNHFSGTTDMSLRGSVYPLRTKTSWPAELKVMVWRKMYFTRGNSESSHSYFHPLISSPMTSGYGKWHHIWVADLECLLYIVCHTADNVT